ncbi:MAG: MATE family efflux transporter, partial [Actinomycetota bacterium]|nr:MATE family efflux transporter [Actinomycetota bacterium]
RAPRRLDPAEARRLLLAGRHLFVRTASLLATMAIATSVAARIGPATLAGHQIALQVHLFVALALDGLAIPGQVLVGTLLGAGDRAETRATSKRLLQLGVVGGVLVAVLIGATAPVLPTLFTNDPAVVDRARVALMVAALVQLPGAVAFVLDGVLIGASDFRYLQWSMVGGLAVFAPFALLVPANPSMGIAGVWAGLLAWMVARAAANVARYRGSSWPAVPA